MEMAMLKKKNFGDIRIFKPGSRYVKDPNFYQFAMMDDSLFSLIDYKEAKIRKDMITPYFSRGAICQLEHLVEEKILKFLDKLKTAALEGKVVDLNHGFSCLTADVVMHYCYQKSFGALDAPDFEFLPILVIEKCFDAAPYTWYFPGLFKFMTAMTQKLPDAVAQKYLPEVAATTWIQRVCHNLICVLDKFSTRQVLESRLN